MFSLRSVATPEARLGHAIHSPPAGSSASRNGLNRGATAARSSKKATITSNGPRTLRRTRTPSGSAPRVTSNPSGALIRPSRAPGLIPSFFGSGVPL
jgi:hypothetical protein